MLAALVVLAGCGAGPAPESPSGTGGPSVTAGPTGTAGPTATTATPPPGTPTASPAWGETVTGTPGPVDIPVRGGSVPVDHERLWRRLVGLVGRRGEPPSRVFFLEGTEGDGFGTVGNSFARRLLDAPPPPERTAPRESGVAVPPRVDTPLEFRYFLAHEFYHGIQFSAVDDSRAFRLAFEGGDHQARRLGAAMIEGLASHVATAYMERYTDATAAEIEAARISYAELSGADRWTFAPYYYGRLYAAARGGPRDHWSLYRRPPATTEELLHQLPPGSAQPRLLSLTVEADRPVVRNGTMGELFVRLVLRSQLNRSRAVAGAAGWGNDTLATVRTADGPGHVWALRWDDAGEATEFTAALEAYLDGRATPMDDGWTADGTAFDVRAAGEDTVVVLVGPPAFVTGTTVDGVDGDVSVDTP